jgi:hypothetical protein
MATRKDIATKTSNSPVLHEGGEKSGSVIEQSLRSLTAEQKQAVGLKAAEEIVRLEVKQREINLEYVAGKKSTEDHIDTWNMLNKEGKTTRQTVTSEIKTGAGKMQIESKSGATCFVATAAYGSRSHPDVVFLRSFRDTVLIRSSSGLLFISWYWRFGPNLAKIVQKVYLLKLFSRKVIGILVWVLRKRFTRI